MVASGGESATFEGEGPVTRSSPVELLADLEGLNWGGPGPERLRTEGECSPFRRLSATTALRDEERGDNKGPGVKRAMDRLDRVDGRPAFDGDSLSPREACGVDGGSDRWASEGSRGDDMVLSSGRGLLWETSPGVSSRGESALDTLDDAVEL